MLVAISAAWMRPEVLKAWCEHTKGLGFDAVIVCVSTEEGLYSDWLVWNAGLTRAWKPNNPLSGKFNEAMRVAMDMGGTRFMILPSDDFASQAWVDEARTSTLDYMYPYTCGIMDAYTQQAYKITKLSFGTLKFGAGRVVSRRVVEACGGTLWPENHNRGLDGASHEIIKRAGFTHTVVETPGIPITDVKTKDNLWAFQTWSGSGSNITPDEALHMCSPSVRAQIDALKQ